MQKSLIFFLLVDITEDKLDGLIIRDYKDAWKRAYAIASEKDKDLLLKLPNFDADIFKDITGIDINSKGNEETVKVEANGKTVYISKDSAKALGLEE